MKLPNSSRFPGYICALSGQVCGQTLLEMWTWAIPPSILLAAVLALSATPGFGAESSEPGADGEKKPPKAVAPGISTQKITVTGSRPTDMEERRLSTASKLVYGREELDRDGDSTVGEILKRLPGVTIGGRRGRGGDIRMRGLGNGYTQILLNGERPPRGFSLDSLAPDQVERIEVIRGPVAEYSTQAIAGTINIVLRDDYRLTQTQVRISGAVEQGRLSPNLSVTYPGDIGALSYVLSGSIYQNRQRDRDLTTTLEHDSAGLTTQDQTIIDERGRRSSGIHFTPRLSYRFEDGDSLVLQPFVMQSRTTTNGASLLTELIATPPYATARENSLSESTVARMFGNWQHRIPGGAKLELKFGGGLGNSDSTLLRQQFDNSPQLLNTLSDVNSTHDTSANLGGKYSTPIGEGHTLATGWNAEWGKRRQTRVSLDNGLPRFADSGDNLGADTRTLSGFAQDEWEIDKQWSLYAGLRWEGIRTASDATNGTLENRSSVWSPVLHGVWRFSESTRDQVRVSLTHSYRAPTLADLIALPALSSLNSPTRPDRIGNPDLKPEMARGIDLAFEHYLSRSGIMSVNVFARNIDDLMRRRISLEDQGSGSRWVSQPFNIGKAATRGMELEAKFQLVEFLVDAPAIDIRSNYSRFWSRVDAVPGPDNRLEQQPTQTANFGLDYRLPGLPLTLGGNFNWTPAYVVQSSESQTISAGPKRQLDIYGLWKFSPAAQLRISANNLLAGESLSGSGYSAAVMTQVANVIAQTYATLTVRLELKI